MDATYIYHSHDFCKRLGSQNRLRSPEGLVSLAATFVSSRNAPPQQGALRDEAKTAVRLQRDPSLAYEAKVVAPLPGYG